MYSVVLGLATNRSDNKILKWLQEVKQEIEELDVGQFKIEVVIYLNGRTAGEERCHK
ncbi:MULTISPECIES: hypothetical protein [Leuconostoc]|uniref:Uncharacterized protein n=1 Tax=Leuconostoc inhae TaxID=178001 RepID=A0AAN2QV87_9LACO|nr:MULTISPECIES: hypothetical protein [Leuconostoc]MBZ5947881.1 hypothetical protein [Leuconostoc gasicomitatum]MBZ5955630.1 hypothetical protein [Leuconostoc gasicomitatum]MBZ5956695.1 hypothetical protein [Leuconostoc gasicomitatum]MBZ5958007.1 hypothetical protein [Leuconostoc gasicomitatum]MBZ5960752.1 hypothetical protein [Leuconostoc gasicomitatum]